jgi:hypothetical protein
MLECRAQYKNSEKDSHSLIDQLDVIEISSLAGLGFLVLPQASHDLASIKNFVTGNQEVKEWT